MREGTDDSQGRNQIISNINACCAVADILKSTLGPCGMDKLIETDREQVISNDGATIINLLDIAHPAARILADISRAQDEEVGDGTTSVVVLAGELLRTAKQFIEEGMNAQFIIRCFKSATAFLLAQLEGLALDLKTDPAVKRNILVRCAETSLNSKLLSHYKAFFGEMVVAAVERLDTQIMDKELIGIKSVIGGSITDSVLVDGVAFKKTFSYAGFEQQPKKFAHPKILLLNVELELKAEKENAEVRIEKPEEYQSIVDAEWKIIYSKLEAIVTSGAQIVLSKLPIGDLATQYFADRGLFCAGRVAKEDANRVSKATGAVLQTTLSDLRPEVLGTCGEFEEVQVGAERFNLFKSCPGSKTATILLRGGAEQFIKEAERSLNDAIMIVRRVIKTEKIIPGGGAIEMELSKLLRNHSREIKGKEQLVINAFAKSLEVIPRTLADNAGLDSNEIISKLRQKHAAGEKHFGVDVWSDDNGVCDTYEKFVWEPLLVKKNYVSSANEAVCQILSIDETIKAPQNEEDRKMRKQPLPGMKPGGMKIK